MMMEKFSATDAALAGFRLVREHPRTVAVWGAILLVVSALTNVLMIVSGGSDVAFPKWPPESADVARMEGQMQALAPVSLLCLLLNLVAFAIIFTGVYRVLLRPSDRGMAHLRFGRDEVRQFLALLTWILMALLAYFAVILVGGMIATIVQLAVGEGALFSLVVVVATLGAFAFMIYAAVRLSFIGVLTFMTGKIDVRGALVLTRGQFWRLFGTYILVFVLFVIVNLIVMMLASMLGLIAGGLAGASQVLQPDMTSLSLLLTPMGAVSLLAVCAMSILGMLVLCSPVPEIYRQWTVDKIDPTTPSWPVLNHDPES